MTPNAISEIQTEVHAATSQPTQKEEGRTALWRAVRSVVGKQRQAPPLQPVPRTGPVPLSFAQERIMRLQQLEPDSSTYNKSIVQRLNGPLNVAALEQNIANVTTWLLRAKLSK
jgi:hypothetical protein